MVNLCMIHIKTASLVCINIITDYRAVARAEIQGGLKPKLRILHLCWKRVALKFYPNFFEVPPCSEKNHETFNQLVWNSNSTRFPITRFPFCFLRSEMVMCYLFFVVIPSTLWQLFLVHFWSELTSFFCNFWVFLSSLNYRGIHEKQICCKRRLWRDRKYSSFFCTLLSSPMAFHRKCNLFRFSALWANHFLLGFSYVSSFGNPAVLWRKQWKQLTKAT